MAASEGLLNHGVRYAMRLYRTSLNLCMILIFKKGSFGTVHSAVQNFCPQRLIEHKKGHAGILKGDQNLFIFSRIP